MVDMLPVYPLAWLYNVVVRNKKRVDVVILNEKIIGFILLCGGIYARSIADLCKHIVSVTRNLLIVGQI